MGAVGAISRVDILLLQDSDGLVAAVSVRRSRVVAGLGLVGRGNVGRLGLGSVGRGNVGRARGGVCRTVNRPIGSSHQGQSSDDELRKDN